MKDLINILVGEDFRSIGQANEVAKAAVQDVATFDELIDLIGSDNEIISMRAADAAEKASQKKPDFLIKHKEFLLGLLVREHRQEVYWHLAMMVPRLPLTKKETEDLFINFETWFDNHDSRIVRVCALQAMYELSLKDSGLVSRLDKRLCEALSSSMPSISARARIISAEIEKHKKD